MSDFMGLSGSQWGAVGGMAMQLIGAYYQASQQKGQLRGAAMQAQFDASMASINARAAERQANAILLAGEQQQAIASARYGQARGSFIAQTGARGVRQSGSAAEVRTSIQVAKELDLAALKQGTVAQSNAARAQAVDFRNRALMSGVSAQNLRKSAGIINPWENVLLGIAGSSGTLARSWQYKDQGGGQSYSAGYEEPQAPGW